MLYSVELVNNYETKRNKKKGNASSVNSAFDIVKVRIEDVQNSLADICCVNLDHLRGDVYSTAPDVCKCRVL